MVEKTLAVRYSKLRTMQPLLRFVLWEKYDRKCYWCLAPILTSDQSQIDHIIPQAADSDQIERYGFASSDDLHEVGNLATICTARKCNQRKSDSLDGNSFAIAEALDKARSMADQVRKKVRKLLAAQGLDKALVQVTSSDLTKESRKLFKRYGPLIVQRLASIDARLPADYLVTETLNLDAEWLIPTGLDELQGADPSTVFLEMNDDLRFAQRAILELKGISAVDILKRSMNGILSEMTTLGHNAKDELENATLDLSDGDLHVHELEYIGTPDGGPGMRLRGSVRCNYHGSQAVSNSTGDTVINVDISAMATIDFQIDVTTQMFDNSAQVDSRVKFQWVTTPVDPESMDVDPSTVYPSEPNESVSESDSSSLQRIASLLRERRTGA